MQWLAGFVVQLFAGPFLEGYKARLAAGNTQDKLATELAVKDIEAERDRRNAQRDLGLLAMSHPLWWIAWGLFVIPVGLYNTAIFALSTLSIPPCTAMLSTGCYTVLEVPSEQAALARSVVEYLFLAQGGAGIAGAIVNRFRAR